MASTKVEEHALPDYATVEEDALPDYATVEADAPTAPASAGFEVKGDPAAFGYTPSAPKSNGPKEEHPYQDFMRSVLNKTVHGLTAGHQDEIAGAVTTGLQRAHILHTPVSVRYDLDTPRPDGTPPHERTVMEQYRLLRDAQRGDQKRSDEQLGAAGIIPEMVGGGITMGGLGLGGTSFGQLALGGGIMSAAQGSGDSEADLTKGEFGQYGKDVLKNGAVGAVAAPLIAGGLQAWGEAGRDAIGYVGGKFANSAPAQWLKQKAANMAIRSVAEHNDIKEMLGPVGEMSIDELNRRKLEYGTRMLDEPQAALGGKPVLAPLRSREQLGNRFAKVEKDYGQQYVNVSKELDAKTYSPITPPPAEPFDANSAGTVPMVRNPFQEPSAPAPSAPQIRDGLKTSPQSPAAMARQGATEPVAPQAPAKPLQRSDTVPNARGAANIRNIKRVDAEERMATPNARVEMPAIQPNKYQVEREKWFADARRAVNSEFSADSQHPQREFLNNEIDKMQGNTAARDKKFMTLSDQEANKQGHYRRLDYTRIEGDQPEALKWFANYERKSGEKQADRIAENLAPELMGKFQEAKSGYGFAAGGANAAAASVGRALKSRIYGNTSKAVGIASQVGSDANPVAKGFYGWLSTVVTDQVLKRGPPTLAWGLNKVAKGEVGSTFAKVIAENAGQLGKFAGVLQRAASEGPDSLDRTVAYLRKNHPDFSKLEETLGGAPPASDGNAR